MGVEGVKIIVDGHERSITDNQGYHKLDQGPDFVSKAIDIAANELLAVATSGQGHTRFSQEARTRKKRFFQFLFSLSQLITCISAHFLFFCEVRFMLYLSV